MMLLPPPDVDPLEGTARDTQGCGHGGESVICDDITPQRRELPLAPALRAAGLEIHQTAWTRTRAPLWCRLGRFVSIWSEKQAFIKEMSRSSERLSRPFFDIVCRFWAILVSLVPLLA